MSDKTTPVSDGSIPLHQLPPWTDNSALITKHQELHHYTTSAGLEGIWRSNTIWATHFESLNDRTEVTALKKPLSSALEVPIKRNLINLRRESLRIRRIVDKSGGVNFTVNKVIKCFINTNYDVSFSGHNKPPLAEPYIASFCSHADDHSYEQFNGLLSQWRGYGGAGRFAIVFDTMQLDNLLKAEWSAHYWTKLELAEVVYLNDECTLERNFPRLIKACLSA